MFTVFWFLVALALIPLWFILSPIFRFLGGCILKVVSKTKKELNKKDDDQFNSKK